MHEASVERSFGEPMNIRQKAEYQRYLQSAAWQATRGRRLALSGNRCEFRSLDEYFLKYEGERCAATTDLHVHHLHYRSLGAEQDNDLEVLCCFHHLVREAEKAECEFCGESAIDQDQAVEVVECAIEDYGGIENVSPECLDVPEICDACDRMLGKDD
jgi:hypothetical protein